MLSRSLHWNTLHTQRKIYTKYTAHTQCNMYPKISKLGSHLHKIHIKVHYIQSTCSVQLYTVMGVYTVYYIYSALCTQHGEESKQCTQLTMFKLEKRAECRGERLRYSRHEMPSGKENSLCERGLIPSRCKISAQIYSTFLRASFSPPPNQTPITYKIIST